jgi:hypothetical protein
VFAVAVVAIAVAVLVFANDSESVDGTRAPTAAGTVSSENVAPPITVETTSPDEPEPEPEPSLFTGTRIAEIVGEVAAARGVDPVRMYSVAVYPGYLFAQVQDPAIPDNVDEYHWRSQLDDPEPVRLNASDDLEAGLYSSHEVDWSAIPALVGRALASLDIDGGEATLVIVERPLPFSTDIRMRVFVNGPRTSGYVDADANGMIFSIDGA